MLRCVCGAVGAEEGVEFRVRVAEGVGGEAGTSCKWGSRGACWRGALVWKGNVSYAPGEWAEDAQLEFRPGGR